MNISTVLIFLAFTFICLLLMAGVIYATIQFVMALFTLQEDD